MANQTATRKQTEVQAAVIHRVMDKQGKCLGYLVKSNHTEEYYQVTAKRSAAGKVHYFCTCAAGQYGAEDCCHRRAVKDVGQARKEMKQQAALAAEVAAIVAEVVEQEAVAAASYDVVAEAASVVRSVEEKALDEAYTIAGEQYMESKKRETARYATRNGHQGFSLLR